MNQRFLAAKDLSQRCVATPSKLTPKTTFPQIQILKAEKTEKKPQTCTKSILKATESPKSDVAKKVHFQPTHFEHRF
jgi:hypothetical protein